MAPLAADPQPLSRAGLLDATRLRCAPRSGCRLKTGVPSPRAILAAGVRNRSRNLSSSKTPPAPTRRRLLDRLHHPQRPQRLLPGEHRVPPLPHRVGHVLKLHPVTRLRVGPGIVGNPPSRMSPAIAPARARRPRPRPGTDRTARSPPPCPARRGSRAANGAPGGSRWCSPPPPSPRSRSAAAPSRDPPLRCCAAGWRCARPPKPPGPTRCCSRSMMWMDCVIRQPPPSSAAVPRHAAFR